MMHFYRTNGVWNAGDPKKPIPTAPIQNHCTEVPLVVAEEAYKEYAVQFGSSQSLKRLNERGGFAASELAILLYERIKRLEKPAPSPAPETEAKS